MFGGPIMIIGLCLAGWAMLASRPYYGFAVTFAVGLFFYNVLTTLFFGAAWPPLFHYFGWSMLFAATVSLVFLAIGAVIVALRKKLSPRSIEASPV